MVFQWTIFFDGGPQENRFKRHHMGDKPLPRIYKQKRTLMKRRAIVRNIADKKSASSCYMPASVQCIFKIVLSVNIAVNLQLRLNVTRTFQNGIIFL